MWFVTNNSDSHSIERDLQYLKNKDVETVQYRLEIIFKNFQEDLLSQQCIELRTFQGKWFTGFNLPVQSCRLLTKSGYTLILPVSSCSF